jgi:hypothetical protein
MYRLVNMCFDKATYPAHAIEPSPINRALSSQSSFFFLRINVTRIYLKLTFLDPTVEFAPTMRGGRQEDAHEFLRLLVEAMQNGALQGRAE